MIYTIAKKVALANYILRWSSAKYISTILSNFEHYMSSQDIPKETFIDLNFIDNIFFDYMDVNRDFTFKSRDGESVYIKKKYIQLCFLINDHKYRMYRMIGRESCLHLSTHMGLSHNLIRHHLANLNKMQEKVVPASRYGYKFIREQNELINLIVQEYGKKNNK